MKHRITHKENLTAFKRVEGQVRGIQRMVEDELNEEEVTYGFDKLC